MALVTRSQRYMPSVFDRFFGTESNLADWNANNYTSPESSLPAVNVKETDDDFYVEVAAPGMKKEDFKINFHNNMLTVSAEKEVKKEEQDDDFSRREFNYQSFQRAFSIRETDVDVDKINAKYEDGILNIKIPKKEESKPKPPREFKVD